MTNVFKQFSLKGIPVMNCCVFALYRDLTNFNRKFAVHAFTLENVNRKFYFGGSDNSSPVSFNLLLLCIYT